MRSLIKYDLSTLLDTSNIFLLLFPLSFYLNLILVLFLLFIHFYSIYLHFVNYFIVDFIFNKNRTIMNSDFWNIKYSFIWLFCNYNSSFSVLLTIWRYLIILFLSWSLALLIILPILRVWFHTLMIVCRSEAIRWQS